MPHRVNQKGDIGTAKLHSDSYDAHNMYLTEEGWVYRHFKTSDKSMWWDEIIVAGQVKPDMIVHGKANDDVTLTNPMKLGSDPAPLKFQGGAGVYDFEYAGQPGHAPDYTNEVVDLADKTMEPGASYRVPGYAQGIPTGWTGVSDPSMVPEKPPFVGDDYQSCNEYNIQNTPLPTPGRDTDPRSVVVGVPDGTCDSVTLSPVTIEPAAPVVGDTLTASGGQPAAPTDGETTPPATATYTWTIPGGTTATGAKVVASVEGTYRVTAAVEGASKTSSVTVSAAPTPPALPFGEPTIGAWLLHDETINAQIYKATVTEAANSVSSDFEATANPVAGAIYPAGTTATVTYASGTLTVTVPQPIEGIYGINSSPFSITGIARSTAGAAGEVAFDVTDFVVVGPAAPAVNIQEVPIQPSNNANASTVTEYQLQVHSAAAALTNSRLQVFDDVGTAGSSVFNASPATTWPWTGTAGSWTNHRYEFSADYSLLVGNNLTTAFINESADVILAAAYTPATPVTVGGYYPLYTTEADSNAHSGGDGTSHTHTLSNTTYYMPNGLTLGSTMWHGDYNNYGGSNGY